MLEFLQSETKAERRRWILVLVDSADGVTGKTGQTGTVKISKNGSEPEDSANNIVEVDAVEMPGHYYIELTAGELDTLGQVSIYYKNSDTLAFHDRGIVTYQDPFAAVGAFGGGSTSNGITVSQAKDMAERVWGVKLTDDKTAKEILLERSTFNPEEDTIMFDQSVSIANFSQIREDLTLLIKRKVDLSDIIKAIKTLPKPADYSGNFQELVDALMNVDGKLDIDLAGFQKAMLDFEGRMDVATEEVNGVIKLVGEFETGFKTLEEQLEKFGSTLGEQTDMDKRLAAASGNLQSTELKKITDAIQETRAELNKKMARILMGQTNLKFDILEDLQPPAAKQQPQLTP